MHVCNGNKQFSKKIAHIHVSDNNGDSDMHLGLGRGNIDWKKVARLIKEINYKKIAPLASLAFY